MKKPVIVYAVSSLFLLVMAAQLSWHLAKSVGWATGLWNRDTLVLTSLGCVGIVLLLLGVLTQIRMMLGIMGWHVDRQGVAPPTVTWNVVKLSKQRNIVYGIIVVVILVLIVSGRTAGVL